MFERPHHQRIASVLQGLDGHLLRAHACSFGGGTAIALRYGEFRESVDITSYARAINNAGQVVGWSNTFGNIGNAAVHATLWDGRTTTDLGTLGGPRSFAFSINDAGQVVGASSTPTSAHATLWSGSSHTPVDLGTLGGATSQALAISNAGQIVGYSDTKASAANNFRSANHATLWSGSSYTAVDLGTLGGTHSYAFAINDAGKMAGWSYTTGNIQAAVWNAHHTGTDLGTPLGAYRNVSSG